MTHGTEQRDAARVALDALAHRLMREARASVEGGGLRPSYEQFIEYTQEVRDSGWHGSTRPFLERTWAGAGFQLAEKAREWEEYTTTARNLEEILPSARPSFDGQMLAVCTAALDGTLAGPSYGDILHEVIANTLGLERPVVVLVEVAALEAQTERIRVTEVAPNSWTGGIVKI